jgi:methyltransferase (TIGR00027 family)
MNTKSRAEKASHTAGYTCFSRACASREKDERVRGPDHMAEVFLPGFAKIILNLPFLRKMFMSRIAPSGIYEYVIARTKVFDQAFREGLKKKVSQIVILGAGMDTRALRFAGENQGTRVVELDSEKTQRPKLDILKRKKVHLPPDLIFASIDFNTQDLREVLVNAGFQLAQTSLFLWEGVTMYLNPDAVDRTLGFIRENSRLGSRVVFDYIYASVLRREHTLYGEEEIFATVSRAGEGWTFGIEENGIQDFLADRGFRLHTHFSPAQLQERYLIGTKRQALGRINGTHCIVQAEVGKNR